VELKKEFASHKPYALAMQYSQDGKYLVSLGMDNVVQCRIVRIGAVRLSAKDSYIAAGYYGGRVVVWDMEGKEVLSFKAHNKHVTGLAISPDEKLMATGTQGNEIRLWALPSGEQVGELLGHETVSMPNRFSMDGKSLYSFGYEGKLIEWDVASQSEKRSFQLKGTDMRGVVISEDESLFGVAMQGQAEIYSCKDFSLVDTLPISTKVCNALSFSSDNKEIALSGGDGKISIFA